MSKNHCHPQVSDSLFRLTGSNWTEEQWRAITMRGNNLLVTAGAGSGKTRVLVQRILQRIMDEEDPVDIDRLLVVTFTNAAAAEMKQRIGAELEKAIIKKGASSTRMRRQLLLLNKATISTIHSFCLELIKRYYYLRDLEPSFRILDETEEALLKGEVLEELLEEYYEKNSPGSPYYSLVDFFATDRGDQNLQELVLRLYDFSRSHPWPDLWLEEALKSFDSPEEKGEKRESWQDFLLEHCRLELESMICHLKEASRIARLPGGPSPYLENLEEEILMLEKLKKAFYSSWDHLFAAMQEVSFGRLKSIRGTGYQEELKERVARIRNGCKKSLIRLKEELFLRPLGEQLEELKLLSPSMHILVELVREFAGRYSSVKREKGLADFSDLEHYALEILKNPGSSPESLLPSEASLDCRRRYAEVLVDEYQDINQVQEIILKLVSRPAPEGNLFMVGDVKQSIYRFRLAEPELFQEKRREYTTIAGESRCIELSHNFRSRREILAGVNFLFGQLMDEEVGEVNYDEKTRLVAGAFYPPGEVPVELIVIHRPATEEAAAEGAVGKDLPPSISALDEGEKEGETPEDDLEELDKASLEGRFIARKIKEITGEGSKSSLKVFDAEKGETRPLSYRDIVILLRSAKNWAPAILEELRSQGIPAYVELETGYFAATEVETMLSLLKIIDNPFQDIPLAAVLRSPLVGLSAEEMARLRTAVPKKSFFEAIRGFLRASPGNLQEDHLAFRLRKFLQDLYFWQDFSRQNSLAELIWQIYRDTGYYDFVGGLPGGSQRQANLRALYDRARRYEKTSFRGLFRFLRFVEKLKERGGDLGEARALGEKEDVVRIMTIHKSKGLEFPVVFLAGLAKEFNLKDLKGGFLLHKKLGLGPRYIDPNLGVSRPTLPWTAIKKRLRLELLAEEMRILYVAMTRAREKLYLVASVNNLAGKITTWEGAALEEKSLLPAQYRCSASSFLDWIAPALMRHPAGEPLRRLSAASRNIVLLEEEEPSSWNIQVISTAELRGMAETFPDARQRPDKLRLQKIKRMEPLPLKEIYGEVIDRCLSWSYPYPDAASCFAKLSVSELNKIISAGLSGEDGEHVSRFKFFPGLSSYFLEQKRLTAAERGTAYHTVMQHLVLSPSLTRCEIERQLEEMVKNELLIPEEKEIIDPEAVLGFFQSSLGKRVLQGKEVFRELPFSMALPAAQVYPDRERFAAGEKVLIQGVIDCLVREEDGGLLLIDYKTGVPEGEDEELRHYFRLQLIYYGLAVEKIWRERVKEKYIYFFDRQEVYQIE